MCTGQDRFVPYLSLQPITSCGETAHLILKVLFIQFFVLCFSLPCLDNIPLHYSCIHLIFVSNDILETL